MKYANPTIQQFKDYWTRDFPYSTDPAEGVTDADIGKAFTQADFFTNQNIFKDQTEYTTGYMLLAAHFLVIDIRLATQGLNSTYTWAVTSKTVGSVSESYAIPTKFQNSPFLTMLSQTGYGSKYIQLLLPRIVGNVFAVAGRTWP